MKNLNEGSASFSQWTKADIYITTHFNIDVKSYNDDYYGAHEMHPHCVTTRHVPSTNFRIHIPCIPKTECPLYVQLISLNVDNYQFLHMLNYSR